MSRETQVVRVLTTCSIGLSVVLVGALAPSNPDMFPALVTATVATLAAWHGIPRVRHSWVLNALLASAVLNGILVVPELALRLAGFRYETGIQFGYPRPRTFIHLKADPQLFWRRNPSDRTVNSLGFVGRECRRPKPPGTRRILFFGDSVTEQGFPEVAGHLLNIRFPSESVRYECVSLATAGYSSYQGRVLVDLYGSSLEPDAAVVLFGWNDHYLAYGAPDACKKVEVAESGGWTTHLYHEVRLIQLVRWGWDTLRRATPRPLNTPRVPQQDYRANLTYMKERLSELGVPVILLTAPTAHSARNVPDYLVRRSFAVDRLSLVNLHGAYNAIVREVSRDTNATLLDLESEFSSLGPREVPSLFSRDGIHLSAAGIAVVASRVAETIPQALLPVPEPVPATGAAP